MPLASLAQRQTLRLRQLNLAASAVLLLVNATLSIPSMVALNGVLVAINLDYVGKARQVRLGRTQEAINM